MQVPCHSFHSLALSSTDPIFSLAPYFFSTPSLWYFQNGFVAFLPAYRLRIFAPPGCSSANSAGVEMSAFRNRYRKPSGGDG